MRRALAVSSVRLKLYLCLFQRRQDNDIGSSDSNGCYDAHAISKWVDTAATAAEDGNGERFRVLVHAVRNVPTVTGSAPDEPADRAKRADGEIGRAHV